MRRGRMFRKAGNPGGDLDTRSREVLMAEMREDAKAVFERLDSTSALLKALIAEADAEEIGANPGQPKDVSK